MTDRVLIGHKNTVEGPPISLVLFGPHAGELDQFNVRSGDYESEDFPPAGKISIKTGGIWYSYLYQYVQGGGLLPLLQFLLVPSQTVQVAHIDGDLVEVGTPASGIWVSKPTANVLAMADVNIPEDDWYGFQEEFDWVAEDGEWANSSPGVNRPYIPEGWVDGEHQASPFGFCTMALYGNAPGFAVALSGPEQIWGVDYDSRGKLKRTTNNTILYTGGYEKQKLFSPVFISANASQSFGGYQYWWRPYSGDIHPDAIFPPDYPVIEMRIRRLPTPNYPQANPGNHDCKLSWSRNTLNGQDGATGANFPGTSGASYMAPNKIDSQPFNTTQPGYTDIFPHEEISGGTPSPWKILEWDLSTHADWGGITNGEYRLHHMNFYLTTANSGLTGTGSTGVAWNPETDPMWEIDYVRVKKASIPAGLGRWNSKQASLLLDSDINHMGLVHQTGTVTIGTAKAYIDGTTSNRVAGHVIDETAKGYVSFPALDYIPLVLFQRIDENVGLTGSSFPGGEDEFSICTQDWEDHRYPTIDMNTSEGIHKGFDIPLVSKVTSSAYFTDNVVGDPYAPPMYENFYSFTSKPTVGFEANHMTLAGLTALTHYKTDGSQEPLPLPWTGEIPATSNRAGRKFSDMVQSFSEVRTFAYARAAKDGFWLTCRNAIGQEGLEPVLNLAPVLPEKGIQNHGTSAYTAMQFQNDNGAWGMFHPALALYDGQKFTEGQRLNWDSTVTANSFLLNKIGQDFWGDTYPQYRWGPNFSCSGLPFSGALARPNDPAPTDKTKFLLSYIRTTDGTDTATNAIHTANGILREGTGGFYPYRYQSNEWLHTALGNWSGASRLPSVDWTGVQYNIKRLSSKGIFHPHGVVPESSLAFDNKNTDFSDRIPGVSANVGVYNQTAYIGGAKNKRFAATKIHTLEFKTDERWPDEPQKSYFGFAGAESTHDANHPYFVLSPPNVVPESILYTLKYTNPTGDGTTSSDYGGELMIANIDGTNPRIFHARNLRGRWTFTARRHSCRCTKSWGWFWIIAYWGSMES